MTTGMSRPLELTKYRVLPTVNYWATMPYVPVPQHTHTQRGDDSTRVLYGPQTLWGLSGDLIHPSAEC